MIKIEFIWLQIITYLLFAEKSSFNPKQITRMRYFIDTLNAADICLFKFGSKLTEKPVLEFMH